jgi:hypothetical protein
LWEICYLKKLLKYPCLNSLIQRYIVFNTSRENFLVALHKFPFKHMENILLAFEDPNRKYSIKDIRKIALSCGPDTREVVYMLSFILSYGKISQTDMGWVKTNELEEKPRKPWRFRFLKEIFDVILILNKNPTSIQEISSETNLDEENVKESLSFLSSITNKGVIKIHGNFFKRKYELQIN